MKIKALVINVSLCALLAGCATSGLEMQVNPNAENDQKHLIIHNDSLANKITINAVQTRMVGEQLEVHLSIQNLTNRDKKVQYRFAWFDAENFEVESGTESWTPIVLHGAAQMNIRGLAPNTSVQSFKLVVREQ